MLLTNIRDGMEYRFFDIQFHALTNKWIAFYNREIQGAPQMIEVLKEEPTDG